MRDTNLSLTRRTLFRLHLRRMRRKLERLRRRGCSDPNVLAILAVEAFYRPRARRAVEYGGWLLLSLVGSRSVARITVGIAQARVSHWHDLGLLDSERFSIRGLARVLDLGANYEVCHRYLSERRMLEDPDATALTTAYTGGQRRKYAEMLEQALAAIAPRCQVARPLAGV
jgi:hypothetical protein